MEGWWGKGIRDGPVASGLHVSITVSSADNYSLHTSTNFDAMREYSRVIAPTETRPPLRNRISITWSHLKLQRYSKLPHKLRMDVRASALTKLSVRNSTHAHVHTTKHILQTQAAKAHLLPSPVRSNLPILMILFLRSSHGTLHESYLARPHCDVLHPR